MSATIALPSATLQYLPEENPFHTVFVDVTHKCNMACKNCYIPNRDIPDMDIDWLCEILARFPRRTRIRVVGAEATTREDLPEIISRIRHLGHLPILLTNGLRISNRSYLKTLKQAGLRSVYLSFNGGLSDEMYLAIDNLACAERKRQALENLIAENMYISLGMILVRGLNESQLGETFHYIKNIRQIYELKVRSVGAFGRYMETSSLKLEEMVQLFCETSGVSPSTILAHRVRETEADFRLGRLKVQFTQWPDYHCPDRGRLAPDGTVQPFFEHIVANEGGY